MKLFCRFWQSGCPPPSKRAWVLWLSWLCLWIFRTHYRIRFHPWNSNLKFPWPKLYFSSETLELTFRSSWWCFWFHNIFYFVLDAFKATSFIHFITIISHQSFIELDNYIQFQFLFSWRSSQQLCIYAIVLEESCLWFCNFFRVLNRVGFHSKLHSHNGYVPCP